MLENLLEYIIKYVNFVYEYENFYEWQYTTYPKWKDDQKQIYPQND